MSATKLTELARKAIAVVTEPDLEACPACSNRRRTNRPTLYKGRHSRLFTIDQCCELSRGCWMLPKQEAIDWWTARREAYIKAKEQRASSHKTKKD